ncbi:hypothetical protein V1292_001201 [Bradyrhizobium sp. AZCC 1719]|uniref:Spy/CpxP family protein refolding chaperone n=1 Tax=Bradyrhizobium sp. AZCC 1719 TaxID=3117028 RepID=UPI002FEF64C1
MTKLGLGIAVIVLATALSAAGYAVAKGGHGGGHGGGRGGGHGHHGGGHGHKHFGARHHGGGHFHGRAARSRSFHAPRINRAAAGGRATNARALARSAAVLKNPAARASLTAGAALAGWQYGRPRGGGWWQHGNGGYGWVGPLFWPFAYNDIYDYTLWGPGVGAPFWFYGYDDIYAGLFGPYDYEGLAGYLPPRGSPGDDRLAQFCGDDSREIAGLPIDLIAQVIEPTEAQRTALDDLANASVTSAQKIKAACPASISLTAAGRLASMQQRIEAMIAGVATVQPALDKFYGLLNDEQKARLNAVAEEQERKAERRGRRSLARACDITQFPGLRWPSEEIEARLRPTDVQRTGLTALQNANTKASEMLSTSCRPEEGATPSARLAAAGKRLDVMLQAVKQVRTALDDFNLTLTDEQKAQFEAIGPRRTSFADRSDMMRRYGRR